jgi:hypothetical protein
LRRKMAEAEQAGGHNAGPAGQGDEHSKPEGKKSKGILENIIDDSKDLFNLGIAASAPLAGFAVTGNPGVLATSSSFILGTRGKKSSKTIRDESLSGAVFGTFANYTNKPLESMTRPGKLAYMIPWVFGANAFYMAEDHIIKNQSASGLAKKFKENYFPVVKKAFMLPAPINIVAAIFLPQQYLLYTLSLATYLFRRFVVGGKGEEYEDKRPFSVVVSGSIGKAAKNFYYGVPSAAYGLGNSVNDLLYRIFKGNHAPAKAAEPAPAHG